MTAFAQLSSILFLFLGRIRVAQSVPNAATVCAANDFCSCNYVGLVANGTIGSMGTTCFSRFICEYDDVTGKFCSGHGTCDFATRVCKCTREFGGPKCAEPYTTFVLPAAARFGMIGFGLFLVVASIALIGWTYKYRDVREVKAMSVFFTYATLVGCVLVCAQSIVIGFGYNEINCVLVEWFGFTGLTLVIGSSLVKSYRIAMIFNKTVSSPYDLTDKKLSRYLVAMMVAILVLLAIYSGVNVATGGAYVRYVAANLTKEPRCNGTSKAALMYGVLVLYEGGLLLSVIIFGNRTRSAGEIFKETRCIYIGSNVGTIMLITFGIFITFTTQLNWQQMIRGFCSLLVVLLLLVLLYKPKFEAVYGTKDNLDENGLSDKDREFKKNFELETKDRTGRELLAMLEVLIGEISYRKKMNMFHLELHETDAVRIEHLLQQVAIKIRTTAAADSKLTGSRKAQAVAGAVKSALELQDLREAEEI